MMSQTGLPERVEASPRAGTRRRIPLTHANRLAGETSPYLLQHANNPIDWYPWGPRRWRARDDKPIFCRSVTRPVTGATSWSAELRERGHAADLNRTLSR
jgi:hypothetical protein